MFQSNQKLDNLDFSKFNNIIFHGLQTATCTQRQALWKLFGVYYYYNCNSRRPERDEILTDFAKDAEFSRSYCILTGSSMVKGKKVNQYLNKFWWIFEMVVTCGFKHGPKVVASSYKWDLWYRIELIIQHWIKMNVFRLNAIAESHIQFWNSSELIKILVYFITLCHGWTCSILHSSSFDWQLWLICLWKSSPKANFCWKAVGRSMDYGHTKAKISNSLLPKLKCQSQIGILELVSKACACRNDGWLFNGKHGQRTHSLKMGADSSAENTPNDLKFFGPICLPKPKNLGFSKKNSLWVSVVRR